MDELGNSPQGAATREIGDIMIHRPPWEQGVWGPGFYVGPQRSLSIFVHEGHRPSLPCRTHLREIYVFLHPQHLLTLPHSNSSLRRVF